MAQRQIATVGGLSGVGFFAAGLAMPHYLAGAPPWVPPALLAVGVVCILAPWVWWFLQGSKDAPPFGDTITVTHSGSGHAFGKVEGDVNIAPERRRLKNPEGQNFAEEIASILTKDRTWFLESVKGDGESAGFRSELSEFLDSKGFDTGRGHFVSEIHPPVYGVRIWRRFEGGQNGRIIVGHIPQEGSIWTKTVM